MGNPFKEISPDLLVIDSKDVVGDIVITTVRNIEKIGKQLYSTFVKIASAQQNIITLQPFKAEQAAPFQLSSNTKQIWR